MLIDVSPSDLAQDVIGRLDAFFPKTDKPGGEYRATQNADGTWNVHDIPFFTSHELTEEEGGGEVDLEWQAESVKIYNARAAVDTYQPPLIVHHHDKHGFNQPMFAGHFRLNRTGKAVLEAAEVDATFTDLMYLDEWIYGMIRMGLLPYLSSEFSFDAREHVHLSLLDHEAPWFKFPLLTIGEEQPFTKEDAEPAAPAIRTGARLLARRQVLAYRKVQEIKMAKRGDEGIEGLKKKLARQEKEMDETKAAIKKAAHPDDEKKRADEEKDKDEKKRADEEKDKEKQKRADEDEEKKKKRADEDKDKDKDKEKPAEQRKRSDELTAEEALAASPELSARFANMEGKLDALSARNAVSEEKTGRQEVIDEAEKTLKGYGIPNLAERVGKQYDLAGGGEHGTTAAKAYVDGLRSTGRAAPPTTWDGDRQPSAIEDDDPLLKAFAGNVDLMPKARAALQNYRQVKENIPSMRSSFRDYLTANHQDLAAKMPKEEKETAGK